jgi:hypothetical protein
LGLPWSVSATTSRNLGEKAIVVLSMAKDIEQDVVENGNKIEVYRRND